MHFRSELNATGRLLFCILLTVLVDGCRGEVNTASRRLNAPSALQKILEGRCLPPTGHALLIGISQYRHWPSLDWPRADAEQLAEVLKKHYGFEDVRLICDEKATRDNILNELNCLAGELKEQDALLIYYAGHGFCPAPDSDAYWVPADGKQNVSPGKAPRQWISNALLKGRLAKLRANQVLVISDSSFSPTLLMRSVSRQSEGKASSQPGNWWCLASGYPEETPTQSSFSRNLIGMLRTPRQGAFTVLDLAEWMRKGASEKGDSTLLAGAMNSTAIDTGNEFVFLRNEVRPPPMLPTREPAKEVSPRSIGDSIAEPVTGKPHLDAMIPREGLADHAQNENRATEIGKLTEQQRTTYARLERDEQKLMVGLTQQESVTPIAGPSVAQPIPEGDPVALSRMARDLFLQGDWAGAAARYEVTLRKKPDDLIALSNLGVVRYQQGELTQAEKIFRDALKLDSQDTFSLTMLGMVLTKEKKTDDAIRVLTEALATRPKDAALLNYRGIAYGQKGDHVAAENDLLHAVSIKPDYAEAHYNLALLYQAENPRFIELARIHYKTARKLALPADPELENALNP